MQSLSIQSKTLAVVSMLALAAAFSHRLFADPLPGGAPAAYTGQPYGSKVAQIPGTIQAEAYDSSPGAVNGLTFNYNGQIAKNALRSTGDSIGLAKFGDGHVTTDGKPQKADQVYVGWTHVGEWMKYTVHVSALATYKIGGQFAAASADCKVSFTFSPSLATGPLPIPTTAGFQPNVEVYHVWKVSDDLGEITLPAGDYVMTVKIESGNGLNLDYYTFVKK